MQSFHLSGTGKAISTMNGEEEKKKRDKPARSMRRRRKGVDGSRNGFIGTPWGA